MEINIRYTGNTAILDLKGNLILGKSEESLRGTITDLLANEHKNLILNLADVPVIDSSGIGSIIKSYTSVKSSGGRLRLLKPSNNTRQLLTITGLNSVLEIYDEESTAVSS